MGELVNVPWLAVSVWPVTAAPEIAGAAETTGTTPAADGKSSAAMFP